MRHRLGQALAGMTAVLVLVSAAGCSGNPAARNPEAGDAGARVPAPAGPTSAGKTAGETEIYVQVLRRYLGTPSENSFPERTFRQIFVLDRTVPGSGEPQTQPPAAGTPIPAGTQRLIVDALTDLGTVSFVADRNSVIVTTDGCAVVKDDGILITLGSADGKGDRVEVGINGFVACLGATWLTYVVAYTTGTGWRVTGTTGPMAIS